MAKKQSVSEYLASLQHKRSDDIARLRTMILDLDADISEQVKWNAPSFGWEGDDHVTMRLHPKDKFELIFHRGAKKQHASNFSFTDPTGRIVWAAPDRGVLTIGDLNVHLPEILELIRLWKVATAAR